MLCEKSMLKIPATIPMVVSECIRHYSLSSQRACTFQVSVPFIESWKRLDSAIALNGTPNGITKADKEARKSDDLVKRDFTADQPLTKCVTDITEIKAKDGKLYVSGIFDCFDSAVLGLAMETNMKATLC